MPPILRLDLAQILSQAFSFLILLWVLRRFAWRPLLGVLDARRARIDGALKDAAEKLAEAERLKQDLTRRLAAIEGEARQKIQEAVTEGRRIAGELQEEARAQSAAILDKAKESVELEVAKAKVMLRDQVARMTVEAMERILRRKIDQRTDQQLVEQILSELEEQRAQA